MINSRIANIQQKLRQHQPASLNLSKPRKKSDNNVKHTLLQNITQTIDFQLLTNKKVKGAFQAS
jgi:hypothetical protein